MPSTKPGAVHFDYHRNVLEIREDRVVWAFHDEALRALLDLASDSTPFANCISQFMDVARERWAPEKATACFLVVAETVKNVFEHSLQTQGLFQLGEGER